MIYYATHGPTVVCADVFPRVMWGVSWTNGTVGRANQKLRTKESSGRANVDFHS